LSESERECYVCGSRVSSDFTATLPQKNLELEIQKTQKLNEQSMDTVRWQKIKGLFDVAQGLEPRDAKSFSTKLAARMSKCAAKSKTY
jgi:aspartate oxidase